jgi:predicted nucleic acid-binding protein
MNICVVDCSFFLSFIMPDEKNYDIDLSSYAVYVPSIFFLECMNVLKTALKKQRITQHQHEECIWAFKDLPFNVDHFSSTQESLQTISRLSREHDLTSYDASYIELALRLKASIGTHDKKMVEACALQKIPLLGVHG